MTIANVDYFETKPAQSGSNGARSDSGAVIFNSLTGLRYILACWIAYFHVGLMFDDSGFGALPLLELGMTRVDVFFVLSGFVLTHVYWARTEGAFKFGDFMIARVARLYPLFLLSLALIVAYLAAGAVIGQGVEPGRYSLRDLGANLLMLQSFGVTEGSDWNFPAWAISAEFAGYLAFPAFLVLATALRSRPLVFLALALLALTGVELGHQALTGRGLNTATTDWGALRGAAVMLTGVAARVAFETFDVPVRRAALIAICGAALALTSALLHLGVPFVAMGAIGFIMGLARIDAAGARTFLSGRIMKRLGTWSYAIFILHAPIYVVIAKGLEVLDIPFEANVWTAAGLVALLTLIAAPVHHLIEEPSRRAIRGAWKSRRPSRARIAAAVS